MNRTWNRCLFSIDKPTEIIEQSRDARVSLPKHVSPQIADAHEPFPIRTSHLARTVSTLRSEVVEVTRTVPLE